MPQNIAALEISIEETDGHEIDKSTVEYYKKLKDKCDQVILKIKDRKAKRNQP